MSKNKQARLRYLRERYKSCWYCKCDLVYYPLKKGEKTPDNYATIEHLNSRLQFPDGRPQAYGQQRTIVVACSKCNWERANLEVAELPIEEVWQRSGRKPLALQLQEIGNDLQSSDPNTNKRQAKAQ